MEIFLKISKHKENNMKNPITKLFLSLQFFGLQIFKKRYVTYLLTGTIVLFTAFVITGKSYAAAPKIPETPACIFSSFTFANTPSSPQAEVGCDYDAIEATFPFIDIESIGRERPMIEAILAWAWNILVGIVFIVVILICFIFTFIINLFIPQY